MDIRVFFQKIREVERNIPDPFTVVVSLETPEGGKEGHLTEVSRASAARLLVEAKARLADADERVKYYKDAQAALVAAEEERMAGKIQLTVVSDQVTRAMKQRQEKG